MLRITAYQDGEWRSIPFEILEEGFLEVCQAHRAQGRALAFAFILFDRGHPYVRSVLATQNYWDALDKRSGRHLSVFSLDVRPPSQQRSIERRGMHAASAPSFDRASEVLAEYFDGFSSLSLPCILFFQVADGRIIDTAAVTLDAGGIRATYQELEAVIGTAADAVARVADENAQNAQEIFNLVSMALRERQQRIGLLRFYGSARPILQAASLFQLLRHVLGY